MGDTRTAKAWYKRSTGPWAWLVYAAVRTVFAIMQALPVDWNLRTSRVLAYIWRWLLPRHHQRAVENLTAAYGNELSPDQIDRLAHRCLESTAMFAVESICLPRVVNRFSFSRYIELVKFDDVLRLLIEDRGIILVTAHYGSFELPGHLLASLGFSTCAVMRPLDNEYLNRFIVNSRRTQGLQLLDKKGAMLRAEQVVRDGSMLAFIGDQDAGRKGMFVNFFGRPASAYKSIGLLAMTTECPIVIGYARRLGDRARYEVGAERIIRPQEWSDQPDPLRWITETYTAAIESIVRADPSQYLWIHRRWKSQPRVSRKSKQPQLEHVQP